MHSNKPLDLLPPKAIAVLTEFQSNQAEGFSGLRAMAKPITSENLLTMSPEEFAALLDSVNLNDLDPYDVLWDMQDEDDDEDTFRQAPT